MKGNWLWKLQILSPRGRAPIRQQPHRSKEPMGLQSVVQRMHTDRDPVGPLSQPQTPRAVADAVVSSVKAAGSWIASSESCLRLSSMPAFLRPFMNLE